METTLHKIAEALKKNRTKAHYKKKTRKEAGYNFFAVTDGEYIKESRLRKIVKLFPPDAKVTFRGGAMHITFKAGSTKESNYHFKTLKDADFKTYNEIAERILE